MDVLRAVLGKGVRMSDKKLEETMTGCHLAMNNIVSLFKEDIERMLSTGAINAIETEKAKYALGFLCQFIEPKIQYYITSKSANELTEALATLKGFFQILEHYEKEQIEKFKHFFIDRNQQ